MQTTETLEERPMEHIVYTLRFNGAATRAGVDGSVLMALATACGW